METKNTTRKATAVLKCCASRHDGSTDIALRSTYPISNVDKALAALWYCDTATKTCPGPRAERFALAADKLRDFLTARLEA